MFAPVLSAGTNQKDATVKYYTAIVEPGDELHAYGVWFPELPAVHSASDEGFVDAIKQAGIALRFYAEDIDEMPASKSMDDLYREDKETRDAVREGGAILVAIPLLDCDSSLIDAAPDMLEALKAIGCVCEYGIGNPMVNGHSVKCKAVSDVIKKASGD